VHFLALECSSVVHNTYVSLSRSRVAFRLDNLIFWGVGMYAVMYMLWRLCVLYGFTEGLLPRLVLLFVLVVIGLLAGRALRFGYASDILPYSAGWMFIAMILDRVLVYPLAGWAMYADWNIWVGYLLILTIPLLAPQIKRLPDEPSIT